MTFRTACRLVSSGRYLVLIDRLTDYIMVSAKFHFTSRRCASAVYPVDMCLMSVGLSITSRWSILKRLYVGSRIQRRAHDSPKSLIFRCKISWRNSNGVIPNVGDKCRGRIFEQEDFKKTSYLTTTITTATTTQFPITSLNRIDRSVQCSTVALYPLDDVVTCVSVAPKIRSFPKIFL